MAEGLPAEAIALQDPITYAGTINNKAVAAIPVVSLYDFALNNIEPPASYTEDANGAPVFADNKTRQRITSINAANATAIKIIKAGMDARLQDAISDKLDGAGPHHLWKALKTAIKPHLAAKIYEDQFNAATQLPDQSLKDFADHLKRIQANLKKHEIEKTDAELSRQLLSRMNRAELHVLLHVEPKTDFDKLYAEIEKLDELQQGNRMVPYTTAYPMTMQMPTPTPTAPTSPAMPAVAPTLQEFMKLLSMAAAAQQTATPHQANNASHRAKKRETDPNSVYIDLSHVPEATEDHIRSLVLCPEQIIRVNFTKMSSGSSSTARAIMVFSGPEEPSRLVSTSVSILGKAIKPVLANKRFQRLSPPVSQKLPGKPHPAELREPDSPISSSNNIGLMDSGCTKTLTNTRAHFLTETPADPITFEGLGGNVLTSTGTIGTILSHDGNVQLASDAHYVPEQTVPLIAFNDVLDNHHDIWIDHQSKTMHVGTLVPSEESHSKLAIPCTKGLWPVPLQNQTTQPSVVAHAWQATNSSKPTLQRWHERLMHPHQDMLVKTVPAVEGMTLPQNSMAIQCSPCIMSKLHRSSAPPSTTIKDSLALQIAADICVMDRDSYLGHKYALCVTILNHNFRVVYPLHKRSESADQIIYFCKHFSGLTNRLISRLRLDQGGENIAQTLRDYCLANGISIEYSATDRHTHNAAVESSIRVMNDRFRASCTAYGINPHYWSDGLPQQADCHNRTVHAKDTKTPYEHIYRTKPDVSLLRVFGCCAFVRLVDKNRAGSKTGIRAVPARFLGTSNHDGHPATILGWKFACSDETSKSSIIVSTDAWFNESCYNVSQLTQLPPPEMTSALSIFPPGPSAATSPETPLEVAVTAFKSHATPMHQQELQGQELQGEPTVVSLEHPAENQPEPSASITQEPLGEQPPDDWESPRRSRSFRPTTPATPQHASTNSFALLQPEDAGDHSDDDDSLTQSFTDAMEDIVIPSQRGSTCDIDNTNILSGKRRRSARALTAIPVVLPTPDNTHRAYLMYNLYQPTIAESCPAHLKPLHEFPSILSQSVPTRITEDYWDYAMGEDTINHFITTVIPDLRFALQARTTNVKSVLQDPIFEAAIREELSRYQEFEAFEIVEIPAHIRKSDMVRFLWNFRLKRDPATGVETPKARLCVDGSRQSTSTYNQTSAHTPYLPELKTALKFGIHHGMEPLKSDQRSAFLHPYIDHDIHAFFPKHFPLPPDVHPSSHCLRILKGANGLKQGGYLWQEHRNKVFESVGLSQCPTSPCFFQKRYPDGVHVIISTHVDDSVHFITKGHLPRLHNLLDKIELQLKSTRGELTSFTGYSLSPAPDGGMYMSQERYLEDILTEYLEQKTFPSGLPVYKPTPWNSNYETEFDDPSPPTPADIEFYKSRSYPRLVGKLMYLVGGTRMDCTYALNRCAQHSRAPKRIHWQMLQHILQYLNGTKTHVFHITPGSVDLQVVGLGDADWGNCPNTRLSRSGVVVKVGDTAILAKSVMQTIVADSTTAAETLALTRTAKEVINIRLLLEWLGVPQQPSTIFCDNASTVHNVSTGTRHKTKHLDMQYRFLDDLVKRQLIAVKHIGTDNMTADILTKGLGVTKHRHHTRHLGIIDPRPAQGECASPIASK